MRRTRYRDGQTPFASGVGGKRDGGGGDPSQAGALQVHVLSLEELVRGYGRARDPMVQTVRVDQNLGRYLQRHQTALSAVIHLTSMGRVSRNLRPEVVGFRWSRRRKISTSTARHETQSLEKPGNEQSEAIRLGRLGTPVI